jgi:hypothetical protein
MSDEIYKELQQKTQSPRRGKILVWYILLPLSLLFAAFKVWQLIAGRI